jgi:hypothetical protein
MDIGDFVFLGAHKEAKSRQKLIKVDKSQR